MQVNASVETIALTAVSRHHQCLPNLDISLYYSIFIEIGASICNLCIDKEEIPDYLCSKGNEVQYEKVYQYQSAYGYFIFRKL